jgi:hypothetical protein
MWMCKFYENMSLKDPFGSSVDHDGENKRTELIHVMMIGVVECLLALTSERNV